MSERKAPQDDTFRLGRACDLLVRNTPAYSTEPSDTDEVMSRSRASGEGGELESNAPVLTAGRALTKAPGMARLSLMLAFGCLVAFVTAAIPACGDDGSCPGTICSDCSGSGDCPTLDCGGGQSLFCVAFPFGELDSSQRCTFCEDPDFQLP